MTSHHLLGMLLAATFSVASATEPRVPEYEIHTVKRQAIATTVSIGGAVTALKTVQLAAQLPGRVASLSGREGDAFEAGSLLVQLDDSALLARYEAAVASRDAALASIRNAEAMMHREIYSPSSDPSQRAPGGMGMPAMMDQMFTAPLQSFGGNRNRQVERHSDYVAAQTRVAQAHTQYAQTEANIKEIEASLRDTQSVAPFAGVIQKVYVEVGDTIQPGTPLLDFSEYGRKKVEADLPIRLARTLSVGQEMAVKLDAESAPVLAPVTRIHPIADARQHTMKIELELPEDANATAGQYAELRVTDKRSSMPAQLTVPMSAVVSKGGLPLVFLVGDDGKARLRVLRLGGEAGSYSRVVLSGVKEGDRIVNRPPPGLTAGVQVVAAPAAAAE